MICTKIIAIVAKKKAEASRGRKQQTRKRGTNKEAVSKDIVTSSEDVISDESPDLNPQDKERQDKPVPATPSPVLPSEPQVKNTPKRATKSKTVQKIFLNAQYFVLFLRLLREVKRMKVWTYKLILQKIVRNILFTINVFRCFLSYKTAAV